MSAKSVMGPFLSLDESRFQTIADDALTSGMEKGISPSQKNKDQNSSTGLITPPRPFFPLQANASQRRNYLFIR